MILCEIITKQRRNAIHAETEQEYLQKNWPKKIKAPQMLLEHQQPSPQLKGFIINHDFQFDPFHFEPIIILQKNIIYKSHFLLLICEDFQLNLKRLQSILDSSETIDNLTDSTRLLSFQIRLLCSYNYFWKLNSQISFMDTQQFKSFRNFQRVILSFIQCIIHYCKNEGNSNKKICFRQNLLKCANLINQSNFILFPILMIYYWKNKIVYQTY